MENTDNKNLSDTLREPYAFWLAFLKENILMQAKEYESNLQKVADVDTLKRFWEIHQHIKRPSELPVNAELFFFKDGIKPVWENKHNRGGGKFIIRARKERCDEIWERMLLSTLTWYHDAICGIVVNIKANEIIISIWTKELEYHTQKEEIKNWIRSTLGISDNVYIEYKEHPFTEDIAPLEKDWNNLLQIAKSSTFNS